MQAVRNHEGPQLWISGPFDMQAYPDYFAGQMHNYEFSEEEMKESLAGVPQVG